MPTPMTIRSNALAVTAIPMCDELLASAKAREIDATLSVFQSFQIMPRSRCLLEEEQVALNIGAVACFGRAAIGHALLSL